jgi:hypothetical protein
MMSTNDTEEAQVDVSLDEKYYKEEDEFLDNDHIG